MFFYLLKYEIQDTLVTMYKITESKNITLFHQNFLIPLCIAWILCIFLFITEQVLLQIILFIMLVFSVVLSSYELNDILTIQLIVFFIPLIFSGFLAFPFNSISFIFCLTMYSVVFIKPSFMGNLDFPLKTFYHDSTEYLMFYLLLVFWWLFFNFLNKTINTHKNNNSTIDHLKTTEKQLTIVNTKLQEFTIKKIELGIEEERMRITRDLHDGCGYVYTNIIALSDAAISMPIFDPQIIYKILNTIRSQASEGLQETRETLHLIRDISNSFSNGIKDIYHIKNIFEEVTNITINIETYNMRKSYGFLIDNSIKNIVQEALTNSLRHGKATKILIHFQEKDHYLNLTVTDNGLGAETIVKGLGLHGMEERIASLYGTIDFSNPQEGGFRLYVSIPLVEYSMLE